jgi:fumarate reductase subunit D
MKKTIDNLYLLNAIIYNIWMAVIKIINQNIIHQTNVHKRSIKIAIFQAAFIRKIEIFKSITF